MSLKTPSSEIKQADFFSLVEQQPDQSVATSDQSAKPEPKQEPTNNQDHLPGLNGLVLDLLGAPDDKLERAFPNRIIARDLAGAVTAPHGS